MARSTPRRLTITDLAILIGGSALTMGLWKMSEETTASKFAPALGGDPYSHAGLILVCVLVGFAPAVLGSRLIRPRPPLRFVFRQPGTAACVAILAHMTYVVLVFSWRSVLGRLVGAPVFGSDFNVYLAANHFSGGWVVAVWGTLVLTRTMRPEPSWIDRAGRLLGIVSILDWLKSSLLW